MKKLLPFLAFLAFTLSANAQLVFRNAGRDTIRIAVGTFYDTSKKAISSSGRFKPVITKGWYRLYPGDSIIIGPLFGPAVYYLSETVKNGRCIADDTFPANRTHDLAGYREALLVRQVFYRDGHPDIRDTSKFSIKHPNTYAGRNLALCFFRIALVSEEAKRQRRLVIELGASAKGLHGISDG